MDLSTCHTEARFLRVGGGGGGVILTKYSRQAKEKISSTAICRFTSAVAIIVAMRDVQGLRYFKEW